MSRHKKKTTPISNENDDRGSKAPSSSDAEYKVGDKHPPEASKWKPGQSGNLKGRPKKKELNDIRSVIEIVFTEEVKASDGDKVRTISREEAIMIAELRNALKGEPRAVESLFKRAQKCGLFTSASVRPFLQLEGPPGDQGRIIRMFHAKEAVIRKFAEDLGFRLIEPPDRSLGPTEEQSGGKEK